MMIVLTLVVAIDQLAAGSATSFRYHGPFLVSSCHQSSPALLWHLRNQIHHPEHTATRPEPAHAHRCLIAKTAKIGWLTSYAPKHH